MFAYALCSFTFPKKKDSFHKRMKKHFLGEISFFHDNIQWIINQNNLLLSKLIQNQNFDPF